MHYESYNLFVMIFNFLHSVPFHIFSQKKSGMLFSNSLDSEQVQHFVGPDLGPNCLQRLFADLPQQGNTKAIEKWSV